MLAVLGLQSRADAQSDSGPPDLSGFVDSGGITDLQEILLQADGSAQLVLTDGTSLILTAAEVQVVNGQIFVSQAALTTAGVGVGAGGGAALLTGATVAGGGAAAAAGAAGGGGGSSESGSPPPPPPPPSNDASPAFTSSGSGSAAENQTAAYSAVATDADGDTITYSISGGDDASQFGIDSSTGQVSFLTAPDFETPGDSDGNNVYQVEITASDGTNSTTQIVEVSVTNENDHSPVITSGSSVSIGENQSAVTTVTATDEDGTDPTFSISGGADAGLFSIDATTGALSFNSAPDYETPGDADGDSVYSVEVTASDGENSVTQTLSITVTDVDENGPEFTSGADASTPENTVNAYTAVAVDAEGEPVTYSIAGGADASEFSIDSTSGALRFNTAPDFERPDDVGGNNVYEVEIAASDGTNSTTQLVSIRVTNRNDVAPSITSPSSVDAAENQTTAFTVEASDGDSGSLAYSISGGADAALFDIDVDTGEVTFVAAPDFEAPGDDGADNIYEVEVSVSDGSFVTTQTVEVSVTNENDNSPAFTSGLTANAAENQTAAYTATADDADGDAPTFSITGGADAALFDIDTDTGAVTFVTAPDFETPGDDGGNNVYEVEITASDGLNDTAQTVSITVTNENDNSPAFTSGNSASVAENQTSAYSASATDADGDTPTFSITGGADAALFNIDSGTGAVTFQAAPDFENPGDDGTNNVYEVEITASDGTNDTAQTVSITVTNENDNSPSFTSGISPEVAENQTAAYTAAATDADGDTPTYAITGGADAALFDIDTDTGAVTFRSAPDFESPGDNDNNNIYVIQVTASDGTNSTPRTVEITVTNENDNSPAFTSGTTSNATENATAAYTATATDADGDTPTFSITGGVDAALFDIDADTGIVTFIAAPDFESPSDSGGNNVYDIEVTATDGTNSTAQNVAITVGDANDNAPVLTAPANTSVDENTTDAVFTASATDTDTVGTLVYSLSGTDAGDFNIDSGTGEVTFASPPDFENPADDNTDNTYQFTVNVTDGVQGDAVDVSVSVNDLTEGPELSAFSVSGVPETYLYYDFIDGVSVDPARTDGNHSYFQAITDDGQIAVFSSQANSGFGDGNSSSFLQVYIKDYETGEVTLISEATDGGFGNNSSSRPDISGDGRYIVFESRADDLGVHDGFAGFYNIFRFDRDANSIVQVDTASDGTAANGHSYNPSVSDDGRYVVFLSYGSNLSSADTTGDLDLYLKDLETQELTLISKDENGNGVNDGAFEWDSIDISGDGRYIVYSTRADQTGSDTNGEYDIYLYDRENDTNTLISTGLNGAQSNSDSFRSSISDDGRYVVFDSRASNLVDGDSTDWDVFLYDTQTGELDIIGGAADNITAYAGGISGDGSTIAFRSPSASFTGESNGNWQVFTHDIASGVSTIISRAPDGNLGDNSGWNSLEVDLSQDGQFAVFQGYYQNLEQEVINNGDVFRADLSRLPDNPNLNRPIEFSIAGDYTGDDTLTVEIDWDGDSSADETIELDPGETSASVFRQFDEATDTTVTISLVDEEGVGFSETVRVQTAEDDDNISLVSADIDGVQGNSSSQEASISGNGRYVAFQSASSNLSDSDTEGGWDVFRKDLVTGEVELVSSTSAGENPSTNWAYTDLQVAISDDGRYVVFRSPDALLAGATGQQIYVKDMETGELSVASSTSGGTAANGSSQAGSISGNGRYVVFHSSATNLVGSDTETLWDIYRKDLQTGDIELISVSSDGSNLSTNNNFNAAISDDGRFVVFRSFEALDSADTNGRWDVYIRDVQEGTTRLVSADENGVVGNGDSLDASVSADGNLVVFNSRATSFAGTSVYQVYLKNMSTGELTLITTGLDGNGGNSTSDQPKISADGRYIVYRSAASNLIEGDTNGQWDVFRYDLQTGETIRISEADNTGLNNNDNSNAYSYQPTISNDGQLIAFHSGATNLVEGGSSGNQIFVRNLTDETAADFTGTDGRDVQIGEDLADSLSGAGGDDVLRGDRGNDTIDGGAGNDEIEGGFGADTLTGGADADRFVYLQPTEGGDTITDFAPGEDKIAVNAGVFEGGLEAGQAVQLVSASEPAASNGDGTFLYDTDSGELYWDEDGTGAGSAVLLATLTGAPSISASDIEVIGQSATADAGGAEKPEAEPLLVEDLGFTTVKFGALMDEELSGPIKAGAGMTTIKQNPLAELPSEGTPVLLDDLGLILPGGEQSQAAKFGVEFADPTAVFEEDLDQEVVLIDTGDGWA